MNGYRGSEWRKWDLHLHSLYTYLNNNYKNITEDVYIQKIIDSGLCSIGLTNYFMFSNEDYELKEKLEAKGITVFMNLEFRLTYRNKDDDLCDFHIIFDNKLETSTIKKFLSNLDVNIGDSTKKASELSSSDIKQQGCIDFNKTMDLLSQEAIGVKGKYLTGILARGKGNSRSANLYESFIKKCDLIIHSTDSENNISEDRSFFESINKPLLQNSDAHSLEKIGNKFTWIKAEPTFEGLKQIIYEPETRVKIQEMKPEEKLGYNVIDSIEFSIPSFCNQKIYFNQNLNTIIGGRSTGKSTLIELLCYKILGDFKNITKSKQEYLKNTIETGNIIVNWINKEADKTPEIEYFPQGRMYELAENKDDFNEIVRNILKEDSAGKELLDFESNQQSASTEIATNIANLFALNKEIENKNISIKENGASQAIKAEIDKIQRNIADISNEEKNTQLLIEEYSDLCKKIELCNKAVERSRKIKELFESFNNIENILDKAIIEKINAIEDENIKKSFNKFEEKIKEDFDKLSNEIVKNASDVINAKSSELKDLKESDAYKNGEDLKKQNSIFDELNKKLEVEKEKFNKVLELEKERDAKQRQQDELLNQIIQKHFLVIKSGEELCKKLNCTRTDLEIKANFKLKTEVLTDFYTNKFNSRSGDKNLSPYDFLNSYQEKDENIEFCKKFIKEALQKKFVLKGGNTEQGVISELFSQFWYTIDYEVSYQNDKFMEMSPGKQAFVVLKMLLDFSKKKCPILIDQPEDSLDNRAIYKELVSYLKQKKIDRQIILVTHNANIVVGADAEQVIVANKNGNDSPNKDGITFQYCAGALENTKTKTDDANVPVLERQGIREHVCEILEGGKEAFDIREKKYGFV
ncbi:MAG: hypothetical protein HDR35_10905 [Treponema sp.]|nr:hypothetical protein [Treponema sp.]